MSTAQSFAGDTIPDLYDRVLGPRIFYGYADDLASRAAKAVQQAEQAAGGEQPTALLELAAGTGILSTRLRASLPNTSLVITDFSEQMLKVAEEKMRKSTLEGTSTIKKNCAHRFEAVDATRLEAFSDGEFDLVASQFGVMFFPDKHRSFTEVHRVLKPGGSYLFNVWGSHEQNRWAQLLQEMLDERWPDNTPGFMTVPFEYHDEQVIRSAVLDAGFTSVTVESLAIESDIPDAAEFARGMVEGNPLADEIRRRGGDPEILLADLEDAFNRELGRKLPLLALVIHASKGP